jgi:hypothetical protein
MANLNETIDLVFEKLKGRIEELGCMGIQLREDFPLLEGGCEYGGLIFYDTDSCGNDEDPLILLNANISAENKIHILSLLLAHAASFFGKGFRVGMVILNQGSVFLQEEDTVYGRKLKTYNIPVLYKEHVIQLARSMVNDLKKKIYEEAA